jgi:DMSO reductase family type II enzyme heme b subunit
MTKARPGALITLALGALLTGRLAAQTEVEQGKVVYEKWCAQCHGDEGAGDGPAAPYLLPRPRDFTTALYQVRSTASGLLPTDPDIMRAIDDGLPGTSMPGWKDKLSSGDRRALLAYIKTFSAFFADSSQLPQALEFGSAPGGGADAISSGKLFYDSIGCHKCHGPLGRGDGKSAPTLKDDNGMPMFAADLTQGWRFNGGATVEEIYRRLRTGIDGTPMPSFSDLIDQKFLTDQELWHVAQYVASLSQPEPPIRDVIRAVRVDGALPASPEDSAWTGVDTYYFPLVGQIIRKPRWFAPAVEGLWVQALHNGDTVAVRIAWHDRSQSPDTAWFAHIRRVYRNLAQDDTVPAEPWPDQLALQFPLRIPEGMERPYFLMGTPQDPAYQWRWSSAGGGTASAGTARGLERYDPLPGGTLAARARFDRGEWSVVFTRALATPDTTSELQFRSGRAIPVAFFAWDGSNGEHGGRMALSSWYFLALDEPTPLRVYVSPVIAAALTLGLGMLWIRRAQRDARNPRRA